MDNPDYPDLGASDAIYQVVGIASEDQFAWSARLGYPSHQGKAGEKFSLSDDEICYLLGGNRIIAGNVGIYRQQVEPGTGRPFKLLFCSLLHVAWRAIRESVRW